MKGETTYNKYKRERRELMALVDKDIQFFAMGQKDFADRTRFIRKMALLYRKEQMDALKQKDKYALVGGQVGEAAKILNEFGKKQDSEK